jgi:ABC-type multidrug transport system ATPase subunit
VCSDFGSIFSTLLPGAFAKLEPPSGLTALDGLEVRVSFGGVWKESLSELSGGQRSLLALSLILALLLFKPAPVYLLDEVDAALDLSHTQNIGKMLKTHFSQSQFIVISLKDGMFNNANVLFRTAFLDGVSTVTRTTPGALAARAAARKSLAAPRPSVVPAAAAAAEAGPAPADELKENEMAVASKSKPARKRTALAPVETAGPAIS